ncbi:Uncharacterized protein GBIM_04191 [Gryllus bimaculatus]|nr:Uncharacterized protein GBIM_04191 [Gryllus bimaculatus]
MFFAGRCDHGSPCEQICQDLHDGMFECDCKEGFVLHRNGYGCLEMNSTLEAASETGNDVTGEGDGDVDGAGDAAVDGPGDAEEDILYQKDASFSAELDVGSPGLDTNSVQLGEAPGGDAGRLGGGAGGGGGEPCSVGRARGPRVAGSSNTAGARTFAPRRCRGGGGSGDPRRPPQRAGGSVRRLANAVRPGLRRWRRVRHGARRGRPAQRRGGAQVPVPAGARRRPLRLGFWFSWDFIQLMLEDKYPGRKSTPRLFEQRG